MNNTKKAFIPLVAFLEQNKGKKVDTILGEIYKMTETKAMTEAVLYDSEGKVFAIYCYYHKQWEKLSEVEYGSKKSHKSGYNTMCKVGTNLWTKRNKTAKDAKAKLLDDVASGKVPPTDLLKRMKVIDDNAVKIDTTDMPKGYKDKPALPQPAKK